MCLLCFQFLLFPLGLLKDIEIMNPGVVISFFLRRSWILLSLCIVTPLGFWFKSYNGPRELWFKHYGAGVLYEIFWCLALFFSCPRRQNPAKIAIAVFAATCILEALQLWHPMFLEKIRATFLGGAILGTTFVWWDFPYYVLGCLIGWLWPWTLCKKHSVPDHIKIPAIVAFTGC